jgi:DNA-binding NtrC family response regulator
MKQILIIDDELSIRSLLSKILEREGYGVMTAPDGKEGMKIVDKMHPDLVITDIIMPEKEGIEIILELKKRYPDIPVIAISGGGLNSSESYLNVAELLGATSVFEKPIEKEKLLHAVEKALRLI